jgi:tRNA(His) 5'-end guanylyltransferase
MEIGNRIKCYEIKSEYYLSKDEPVIIRIDGHHFSKFTSGFKKPFDHIFRTAMIETTKDLHNRFNAYTSYTQSDEISLYLPVLKDKRTNENLEHQFNGRTQKLVSLASAYATVCFNRHLRKLLEDYKQTIDNENSNDEFNDEMRDYAKKWKYHRSLLNKLDLAYFDARAFNVPCIEEVANTFIWRARDCVKNSKGTFAQAYCSHKELQNKNSEEQIQYTLENYNADWNTIEDKYKYGILIKKELYQKEIDIHSGETGLCTRSRLKELYVPMNTYTDELVQLISQKNI